MDVILHDPADAFCSLYDAANRSVIVANAETWRDEPGFNRHVEFIRNQALADEYVLAGEPAGPPGTKWPLQKRIAAALYGLDAALLEVHPLKGNTIRLTSESLLAAFERYQTSASLSSPGIPGILVPRFASPPDGPADHFRDLFGSVQRLTAAELARLGDAEIQLPPSPGAPSAFRGWQPARPLRVACCGFVAEPNELEWHVERRGAYEYFSVAIRDVPCVVKRVPELLEAIDRSGAQIAVLPESVLSATLLGHWRDAIRARGSGSELRLLLPGTGNLGATSPPSNVAPLLDGQTGEEVLRAYKRHRFRIPADSRNEYGLGSTRAVDIHEDLAVASLPPMALLDLPIGRVGVLICEDLAAVEHLATPLTSLGVSLLLVPLLSRPAKAPFRWAHRRAETYIARHGATVVLSDSPAVALRTGIKLPVNTAMVLGPHGWAFGSSSGGTELTVFDIVAGTAPRPVSGGTAGGGTKTPPGLAARRGARRKRRGSAS
jgi:predicted amidohydrolase